MKTFLCVLIILFGFNLAAQRPCATSNYQQQLAQQDPLVGKQLMAAEQFIQQQQTMAPARKSHSTTNSIIKIPVVVHILYNTDAQNISDEQVKSGISVLNRDFRKQNADTTNTPAYFKSLAADVEIDFVLATADPKGRPTTGIVRKKTNTTDWGVDDKIKFTSLGGDDAWDSKSYLNIWIGPMRKLLGFSSAPGSPANKDGIVINTSVFGTIHTNEPYHLGRTAVHEVGHWLGLKHIWGDASCGDDGIEDTPVQAGFTAGCPTGIRTTCSNRSTGDMYMNYMDFTNDACLNLFTYGQKERMRTVFNFEGPRYSLLFSRGSGIPWAEEAVLPEEEVSAELVNIYPNPTQGSVILQLGSQANWMGKRVKIINLNSITVHTTIITSKAQRISLAHLPTGIYFLIAENGDKHIKQKIVKL